MDKILSIPSYGLVLAAATSVGKYIYFNFISTF